MAGVEEEAVLEQLQKTREQASKLRDALEWVDKYRPQEPAMLVRVPNVRVRVEALGQPPLVPSPRCRGLVGRWGLGFRQ